MSKISYYPSADLPLQLSDRLIGTEAPKIPASPTPLATKNFSLSELLQLFSSNFPAASLQAVLNTGNTATQNITLVGTIISTVIKPTNIEDTSGSQGITFQVLSKGTSSINWINMPVDNLQAVLNAGSVATGNITLVGDITSTKIIPGNIQDDTAGIGTVGQVLSKTSTGIRWVANPASYTAGLADVLSVGNTATNNINLIGNITATSFIKSGGTSLQFLKADGSVDSNTYFQLPALTSGSVLFSDGTTIAQNNTNFFWNNSSIGLCLGGTTLDSNIIFQINGGKGARISGTAAGFGYSLVRGSETSSFTNSASAGVLSSTNTLIFNTAATIRVLVNSSGNVLINTTTDAGFKLDVNGTARIKAQSALSTEVTFSVRNSADTRNFLVVNGAGDVFNNGAGGVTTNTFFGENSGRLTTAGGNSFIGLQAGQNNTTGGNNLFVGLNAGQNNTTGAGNSFVGVSSGLNNIAGNGNSFFGSLAGRYIADGITNLTAVENSVFLGYNTRALADNQINQIVIGHNAIGIGSNSVVLGNDSITKTALKGNVLINTTTDAGFRLDVNGSVRTTGSISATSLLARGTYLNQTLVATANNDVLVGLDIQSTFTLGAFTGVSRFPLRIRNSANDGSVFGVTSDGVVRWGSRIESGNSTGQLSWDTDLVFMNAAFNLGFRTGGSDRMRIFSTGNVGINTTTDAGFRLDVNGTARVSGNTTINGFVFNNGLFSNSGILNIYHRQDISVGVGLITNSATTSVSRTTFVINDNFAPTSGTNTYSNIVLQPIINQTGTATGITRGLYITPTLTAAADFRAIETTAGNVLFGASGTGFYWDNTNNRLGIGTNAPATTFQVLGTSTTQNIAAQTNATYDIGLVATRFRDGWFSRNLNCGTIWSNNLAIATTNLTLYNAAVSIIGTLFGSGNLLLSTGTQTDAGFKLDVNGTARVSGAFRADNTLLVNGTSINASAIAQFDSGTRGFLPPRMTTTQKNAIATPAAGLVVYDTTDNKHYGYNGTTWNAFY